MTEEVEQLRRSLISKWRSRQERESTSKVAVEVFNFLRKLISQEKHANVNELITSLKSNGKIIAAMEPSELIIVNIVMMVTKLVRDEANKSGKEVPQSLDGLWSVVGNEGKDVNVKNLKRELLSNIKELITEIGSCQDSIAEHSVELIAQQDVVLTQQLATSSTLKVFLEHARKSAKFRAYTVVEESQFDSTPEFVTPIEMRDIGGRMVEVTKVVLSCAVVFPDGSCLVPSGGLVIALMAQKHNVPVYILAAFYKIMPQFIPDPQALNAARRPNLDFSLSNKYRGKVNIVQPVFDIIPASLISLFVSNSGCIIPAHVNRLKEDYYHSQDLTLSD